MIKRIQLGLLLSLFLVPLTMAQTGTLTGTVTDQRTNEPIPGANILVQELERGAATDIDGNYSITNIPYGTYNLRVTFIGYRPITQQVNISAETQTQNFELREDVLGMQELVVTGQGTGVERQRLSSNVTSISARQIDRLPTVQLDQLLQGNIPNSQIRASSGSPGQASLIRGRGVVSALTATTPVIYIDGVRVDNTTGFALNRGTGGAQSSAIADIPVENIERIEFVSGGAATTQFGSDAANGVIQIFTKTGVQGRTDFSLQSSIGAEFATKDFLKYDRSGDILFTPGVTQEYRLAASGGTETFTYSFSGSMRGSQGVVQPGGDDAVRHNLRGSFAADLSPVVRYSGSFGFTSHEFSRNISANFSGSIFDIETGSFGNPDEWTDEEFETNKQFIRTYVGLHDITEDIKRFQTSQTLNFRFREGLTARAVVGVDFRNSNQFFRESNAYLIARGFEPEGTTDQGNLTQTDRNFLGLTIEASARHEASINDFSFITNVGAQLFRYDDLQTSIFSSGLPDGSRNAQTGQDRTGSNFERTVANYGLYALENIGYRDTYFLELGIRADQNTAFGAEVDTQVYPKIGVIYNVSNEGFFRDLVSSRYISNLRFRANLGYAGNFPTPFSNEVLAGVGGYLGQSYIDFGTPGDVNLKPERTKTFEVGGDIAFYDDRFNFEITYFESETRDALFNAPFARSVGLGTALQNLGLIQNSGIEIAGNFNVLRTRDATVNLRASFNTLTNEVVDNGDSAPFNVGGFAFLGSFVDEGFPVGYFRGNRMVFDDAGNVSEIIPNDNLGKPLPDYFGNIGLNADYRGLTLTVTADWQLGAQAVWPDELLRFFAGLGDERTDPVPAGASFFDFANLYVEDADFLKVRLISLNYAVPTRFTEGLFRRVSVGATITNPLNFTSTAFDPEVTGAGIAQGQGGVGVGGFSYRQQSANRQLYGTVRIDF
ncbi:MAG: TonB-dependent receptor [Balneolaceae bacterium]|nr:MAG: TonB-dependent receptor [Balneolaceae bacterium]